MNKTINGFTLIELLIVIAIIGILATISVTTYSGIQANSRDSARSSDIKIIAESLEKYFDRNGEYPGCLAMVSSPTTVTTNTLPGVSSKILTAPGGTAGVNSITCGDITGTGPDVFAYVATGPGCANGSNCLNYTLKYRSESNDPKCNNGICSVTSRRTADAVNLTNPVAGATTNSSTQITLSWNTVSMAQTYTTEISNNSGFTSPTTLTGITGISHIYSGLTAGRQYYFRVSALATGFTTTVSNAVNATTTVDAPAAPTTTTRLEIIDVFGDTSAVTCQAGTTPMYAVATNVNDGVLTAWSAWSSSPPSLYQYASEGYKYGFTSKARCDGVDAISSESIGAGAFWIQPIFSPPAPGWAGPDHFHDGVHAGINYVSYCPAGTWAINGTFVSQAAWNGSWWGPHGWGFSDYWSASGIGSYVRYYGNYQCQSSYYTSDLSAQSYNAIYVYN